MCVVLILTACTQHAIKSNHAEQLTQKQTPICTYKHIKGIAELISENSQQYTFMFYPNNIAFKLSKVQFDSSLTIGTELKATYEHLLKGPDSCLKQLPRILNHHIKSSGI